jgi:protein gp37
MGENSKIEWCDHTMNFWVGCTKVSAACDHCYAESWAKRSGHPELWDGERRRTSPSLWRQPLRWNLDRLGIGNPRARVFTNSLADFFDNQVPSEWRGDAWDIIGKTPNLDWLILTKRPQNIAKMLPAGWNDGLWPNVWLGMTCENQEEYDRRANYLYSVIAPVRFISYEPALGPLVLDEDAPLDWVIAGGESGPNARPIEVEWFFNLRDQCARQGIYFFMKQMGGKRKPFEPIPDDLLIREFPRSAA